MPVYPGAFPDLGSAFDPTRTVARAGTEDSTPGSQRPISDRRLTSPADDSGLDSVAALTGAFGVRRAERLLVDRRVKAGLHRRVNMIAGIDRQGGKESLFDRNRTL
jgi:hypothetical protein